MWGKAALLTLALGWPGTPPVPAPSAFEAYPLAGRVFLVDPGHGGIDSGCHAGSLMEKDIALAVGLELTRLLRQAGARTGITRNADMELGHMMAGPRSRYHRDLATRVALARRLAPDLFISVHVNASRHPSHYGAMVFYRVSDAVSRRAARLILEEVRAVAPGNQNAALAADLYVLRQHPHPAVLVELGFLTHPQDRQLLTSPQGQRALAGAIFRGVVRLFAQEPGPDAPPPEHHSRPDGVGLEQALLVDPELCPGHEEPPPDS